MIQHKIHPTGTLYFLLYLMPDNFNCRGESLNFMDKTRLNDYMQCILFSCFSIGYMESFL